MAQDATPSFISLKSLVEKNIIKDLHPKLRVNSNGYPYITWIGKNNSANNVYFSVNSSKLILGDLNKDVLNDNNEVIGKGMGLREGSSVLPLIEELSFGQTANSDSEQRFKMSIIQKRLGTSVLKGLLGLTISSDDELTVDFNYDEFAEEFTTVEEQQDNAQELIKETQASIADMTAKLTSATGAKKTKLKDDLAKATAKLAELEA